MRKHNFVSRGLNIILTYNADLNQQCNPSITLYLNRLFYPAPTRERSGLVAAGAGARGARRCAGAGAGAGAAAGAGARAPSSRLPRHRRRFSTHTTRADIMIWRQSKFLLIMPFESGFTLDFILTKFFL